MFYGTKDDWLHACMGGYDGVVVSFKYFGSSVCINAFRMPSNQRNLLKNFKTTI